MIKQYTDKKEKKQLIFIKLRHGFIVHLIISVWEKNKKKPSGRYINFNIIYKINI